MANALFGVPQDYTIAASAAGTYPISNVTNDEPGLVYSANLGSSGATYTTTNIDIDVTGTDPIGVVAVLFGMNVTPYQPGFFKLRWTAYNSSGARSSGSYIYDSGEILSPEMSSNRSADTAKHAHVLVATQTARYWRLSVTGVSSPRDFRPWRILMCKKIQPPDNIEASPENGIDDRSDRRYTRTGRRVIDPTIICPTFKGTWPWIDDAQAKADFRPLMYKRGGTYPVLFILDYADSAWGEDAFFYGDLEKSMSLVPDEAGLWSFSFAIVSIAP